MNEFTEIAYKYGANVALQAPKTVMSAEKFPAPATGHTLELVYDSIWSRPITADAFTRFNRRRPAEATVAHRFWDDAEGCYRLEPVLTVDVVDASDVRGTRFSRRDRATKQLARAVSDFNKAMAQAERIAHGRDPLSRWQRFWLKLRNGR